MRFQGDAERKRKAAAPAVDSSDEEMAQAAPTDSSEYSEPPSDADSQSDEDARPMTWQSTLFG